MYKRLHGLLVFITVVFTSCHVIHTLVPRGRKPGAGRKNGGAGSKGKDKKLSGTESEQEVGLGFIACDIDILKRNDHHTKNNLFTSIIWMCFGVRRLSVVFVVMETGGLRRQ